MLVLQAFPGLTRNERRKITRSIRDWWPDKKMEVPSLWDLVRVAQKIPKRQWAPGFDCDDFAEEYLCKARQTNRHWTIGPVIFNKTPRTGTHMMCISVATNKKGKLGVYVIEAQKVGKAAAGHLLRRPGIGYKLRCLKF